MILEAIISALTGMLKLIFGIFPDLPDIPTAVSDGGDWAVDTIGGAMGFMTVLYSAPLLVAIVVLLVALLAFDQIYWLVLWVLKKIPILGIK
jgi:hypothetical protein